MGIRHCIGISAAVLSAVLVAGGGIALGTGGWAQVTHVSDIPACSLNHVPLKGRVQIVREGADYRVQVTKYFPEVELAVVGHVPDLCGEWQFVRDEPDFTIMLVRADYDLRIRLNTTQTAMR